MSVSVQLARLTVDTVADPSQLAPALEKIREHLNATKADADRLKNLPVTLKGDSEATGALGRIREAGRLLRGELEKLTGLNVAGLLKFGSLAGLIGGLGLFTKQAIESEDRGMMLRATLGAMGLEADKTAESFERLADSLARKTTLNKREILDLELMAARMGVNKDRAEDLTKTAIALSARLGKAPEEILGALERAEADPGSERARHAMMALSPEIRKAAKEGKDLGAVIQQLAQQGMVIAEAKTRTLEGRLGMLRKEFSALGVSIGKALTPLVRPAIEGLTAAARDALQVVRSLGQELASVVRDAARSIGAATGETRNPGEMLGDAFTNIATALRVSLLQLQLWREEGLLAVEEFVAGFKERIGGGWVDSIKEACASALGTFERFFNWLAEKLKYVTAFFKGFAEPLKAVLKGPGNIFGFGDLSKIASEGVLKEDVGAVPPGAERTTVNPERLEAIKRLRDEMRGIQDREEDRKNKRGEFAPGGTGGAEGFGKLDLGGGKAHIEDLNAFANRLKAAAGGIKTPEQAAADNAKKQVEEQQKANTKLDTISGILAGMAAGIMQQPKPGTLPT